MTAWHAGPRAPFDFESTGVDVENDRVVTACVALLRPAAGKWDVKVKSWLINPGIDIPDGASEIHGITTAHAKEHGTDPAETLDLIAGELALAQSRGIPVVGSNLAYDNTLLDRELRRHLLPTMEERLGRPLGPCIDVYVIDKAIDPYRKGSRKLVDLCANYGVRIDNAHDSTFDALAAARVAYVIGQRAQMPAERLRALYVGRKQPEQIVRAFHRLRDLSLAQLHELQSGWYRKQSEGLGSHWQRKANEIRHSADNVDTAEEREVLLGDAQLLEKRLESLSFEWPLRTYQPQGVLV
jgi:DNA polymerase-3 subunit epsilon